MMGIMNELIRIDFHDWGSMSNAVQVLHDSPFELASAKYDSNEMEWSGVFLRPIEDPEKITMKSHFLFLTRYNTHFLVTKLTLSGVTSYSIVDKAEIGTYSFNVMKKRGNVCRLQFNENMHIDLSMQSGPVGNIADIEDSERRGYYTTFLGIESGPYFEEES
jgi:hypothetical protein